MRFRVLGPLEVWCEGAWRSIGTDKPRSLFACLLLNAGQIVSVDTLVFELWGDAMPSSAANLVSVYVHQLRRALGDAEGRILVHRRPGYQVTVSAEDTDLQRFESLAAQGRDKMAAGDAEAAAELLGEADGLWRGRFLADVVPSALVSAEAERAAEMRLSAAEWRLAADLECGRHAEVIPELRRMVVEHPLRERLWLLLMRGLSDAGRHAEAVSAYEHARLVIADQLGVDPGPELQRFRAGLVAGAGPVSPLGTSGAVVNPEPGQPSARAVPVGIDNAAAEDKMAISERRGGLALQPGKPRSLLASPAQLPTDIPDFTGRSAEVDWVCDMLIGQRTGAVRVAMVAGPAGMGKTALAVHAAHRVRPLFPDGQLYADLRGSSGAPAEPSAVLARFLRDLGVDSGRVPDDREERAALFRTMLADRRVLIMLDDACSPGQLQPLLPGSPSCAVLATSRERTSSMAGGGFLDLETMQVPEALELFSRIAGEHRASAEPEAVKEIVTACGGLPLAVRVCAARLAQRGQWPVAELAARLRDEHRRLDELRLGDLEIRASFRASYDSLPVLDGPVAPARAFRLLGLWQGQGISLSAAAALLGEREADVAGPLERLVDAGLLESPEPNCYRFHDLLRLFAAERAQAEEPEEERHAAEARLLQWNLGMTADTAKTLCPGR